MGSLILLGVLWNSFAPGGISGNVLRKTITSLVFYLFLPALVFEVLVGAEIGFNTFKIASLAAIGVISCGLLAFALSQAFKYKNTIAGAFILACAFPNATYLGLPILAATFGSWAREIAIQYDLFACLPLLLTAGVAVARHFGSHAGDAQHKDSLYRVPAIWAAVLAIICNSYQIAMPEALMQSLHLMGQAVTPLMLISVGTSLSLAAINKKQIKILVPIMVIQLLIMPLIVTTMALLIAVPDRLFAPVVLEAAMPSMLIGIVFCERYGLDTRLYAAAVTLSTILCAFTLPAWRIIAENSLTL
jgi:predicted permease